MKKYKVNSIEKGSLIITGNSESEVWKQAEILTDFCSPWDVVEPHKIEFKALWDKEQLFFSFKVYDPSVYLVKTDNTNASINDSDRVELFFRSDAKLNPYYCLEMDPSPRIMDFKAEPNRKFDFNWKWPKEAIDVKSSIKESYFSVEGAIGISTLEKLELLKNNKIETGIFRAKYNKGENDSYEPTWIPWVNPNTDTPDFHTASAFGVLELF